MNALYGVVTASFVLFLAWLVYEQVAVAWRRVHYARGNWSKLTQRERYRVVASALCAGIVSAAFCLYLAALWHPEILLQVSSVIGWTIYALVLIVSIALLFSS